MFWLVPSSCPDVSLMIMRISLMSAVSPCRHHGDQSSAGRRVWVCRVGKEVRRCTLSSDVANIYERHLSGVLTHIVRSSGYCKTMLLLRATLDFSLVLVRACGLILRRIRIHRTG